jgi:hypothetical protein
MELGHQDKIFQAHLLLILKRTSQFLSSPDLTNILSLNHFFHSHLQNMEVMSGFIFSFLTFRTNIPTNSENFSEVFQKFSGISTTSLTEIFEILKKSKNLIKNPYGKEGLQHWIVDNGGHGWAVEDFTVYRNLNRVFVSSFNWGSLTQRIDLNGLVRSDMKCTLIVGSPVCRRFDCESMAKLKIKILAGNNTREQTQSIELDEYFESNPWFLIINQIELNADDEVAVLEFSGKDKKFWAGHYGARFGYCFAYIIHH